MANPKAANEKMVTATMISIKVKPPLLLIFIRLTQTP